MLKQENTKAKKKKPKEETIDQPLSRHIGSRYQMIKINVIYPSIMPQVLIIKLNTKSNKMRWIQPQKLNPNLNWMEDQKQKNV